MRTKEGIVGIFVSKIMYNKATNHDRFQPSCGNLQATIWLS